jgi:BirA family biotin operon repressor/biotin-[acetyl-CoA-carboxylase] ligase
MNLKVLRFDTVDSTNSEAARQAKLGAGEGLCIIAREQTAGRGRHGRSWVSEKDAGLYFSIVLRPKIDTRYLPLITLMAGVAVHDALEEFGLDTDIKWVNDILVNEKKLCGILAETADTSAGLAVIVGIGVNLTSRNFPEEIADTATSLDAVLSETGAVATGEVETTLTKSLSYWYAVLCGENGNAQILEEWQRRSSYFSGKSVRVALERDIFEGITDGLEENGALRIKTGEGLLRIIQTGQVERLRAS